jgi:hypothetical protein
VVASNREERQKPMPCGQFADNMASCKATGSAGQRSLPLACIAAVRRADKLRRMAASTSLVGLAIMANTDYGA